MKIVTSGKPYLDIDAYASCIAYQELLNLKGMPAIAVSSSQWNESISPTVRMWGAPLTVMYNDAEDDSFVLVDVSDPDSLDEVVKVEKVEEVIDHHTGYEEFWRTKLGEKADLQFIGAACTMVYERFRDSGLLLSISELSSRLLITGILDNTLNFKAQVTSDRDHEAFNALLPKAHLPQDWPRQYFSECQASIESDLGLAIRNDVKSMVFPFAKFPIRFAQLTIWDGRELLQKRKEELMKALNQMYNSWILNIISITEGKSYVVSPDPKLQEPFSKLLGVTFFDSLAVCDRLWLRKEMSKAAQEGGVK